MGVPYNLPSPRQVTDAGATSPPPPLPHQPLGSLGKNQLPPSTEPPPSPGNCHLELASVIASFWPLNLGQKSWFGHKMTE